MNVDRLLKKNYERYIGAIGFATAAHSVSENQEGGSLHMHGHVHGTWHIYVIRNWFHKEIFRKKWSNFWTQLLPVRFQTRLLASEAYLDASEIHLDAAELT